MDVSNTRSFRFKPISILLLTVVSLAVFTFAALLSRDAWIVQDDAGFLSTYLQSSLADRITQILGYVPGRNLHIVWQYASYQITQPLANDFVLYHIFQSFLWAVNVWLFGLVLIACRVPPFLAISVAALFGLWPGYAEVLWWASALPMHLFSTTAVLVLALTLLRTFDSELSLTSSLTLFFSYLIAFFTYDQSAAAATALLCIWWLGRITVRRTRRSRSETWGIALLIVVPVSTYLGLVLFVRPDATGPIFTEGLGLRLGYQSALSILYVGLPTQWSLPGEAPYSVLIAGGITRLLILFTLLTWFVLRRCRNSRLIVSDPYSARMSQLALVAAVSGLAAAFPSWIWYVSPRHTYLPAMFFLGASLLLLSAVLQWLPRRLTPYLIAAALAGIVGASTAAAVSLVEFDKQWDARTEIRRSVYSQVLSAIEAQGRYAATCLKILPDDLEFQQGPFYAEVFTAGLAIYSRLSIRVPECRLGVAGIQVTLKDSNSGSALSDVLIRVP